MKKHYAFTVEGIDGNGNPWRTGGDFECEPRLAYDAAMQATFTQLTNGKAVYGKPGVGCKGPYDFRLVVIEQVLQ